MTGQLEITSEKDITIVILNKPEIHNAFNDELIAELTGFFKAMMAEPREKRAVILTGKGRSFCAGADLKWMEKTRNYTRDENLEDAKKLAKMFTVINNCPVPVIGRINGHAIGGGAGLVSVCDLAVAVSRAKFAFTEVKVGIIPAVISPHVVPKLGITRARDLFITGRRFTAREALDYRLITHVVEDENELDMVVETLVEEIRTAGPVASREAKKLVQGFNAYMNPEFERELIELIAGLRTSKEGKEGISAFLEKRKPYWSKNN
ncbi:MAG: enoyl-CoA hydratase-related protein [Candidatus Odinarchaeota archaeon]